MLFTAPDFGTHLLQVYDTAHTILIGSYYSSNENTTFKVSTMLAAVGATPDKGYYPIGIYTDNSSQDIFYLSDTISFSTASGGKNSSYWWQVRLIENNGDLTTTPYYPTYIKNNGAWIKGNPYIKKNGIWIKMFQERKWQLMI